MPAWDDDGVLIDDPKREISLIYYESRRYLEERIMRIESGRSSASVPLPRTCHLVTGVRIEREEPERLYVESSFSVHSFKRGKIETFFGAYEHVLKRSGDRLTIASKKILLMNDAIPSVLDVYSV